MRVSSRAVIGIGILWFTGCGGGSGESGGEADGGRIACTYENSEGSLLCLEVPKGENDDPLCPLGNEQIGGNWAASDLGDLLSVKESCRDGSLGECSLPTRTGVPLRLFYYDRNGESYCGESAETLFGEVGCLYLHPEWGEFCFDLLGVADYSCPKKAEDVVIENLKVSQLGTFVSQLGRCKEELEGSCLILIDPHQGRKMLLNYYTEEGKPLCDSLKQSDGNDGEPQQEGTACLYHHPPYWGDLCLYTADRVGDREVCPGTEEPLRSDLEGMMVWEVFGQRVGDDLRCPLGYRDSCRFFRPEEAEGLNLFLYHYGPNGDQLCEEFGL